MTNPRERARFSAEKSEAVERGKKKKRKCEKNITRGPLTIYAMISLQIRGKNSRLFYETAYAKRKIFFRDDIRRMHRNDVPFFPTRRRRNIALHTGYTFCNENASDSRCGSYKCYKDKGVLW